MWRGGKMTMGFLRTFRSAATNSRIARLTSGMRGMPVDAVQLAPRICGHCLGRGKGWRGATCRFCGGVGTVRQFVPDDPTNVVLVAGPSGLGQQELVAVALSDGRPALVHCRRENGCQACLYVSAQRPTHAVRWIRRAAGQQEPAPLRGSPRR